MPARLQAGLGKKSWRGKMRKNTAFICCFLLLCMTLFLTGAAHAKTLVVSPHPDDDVISSSGVIYRALQDGEQVRVVYITNGDISSTSEGILRQGSAVNGEAFLGMIESNLIFLGYPDGSLFTMYDLYPNSTDWYQTNPNGQTTTYGTRGLGSEDYHMYRFASHANYNGYNVILDLSTIINEFRPDHIFMPSAHDNNSDHATTNMLVNAALSSVVSGAPTYSPTIHIFIIWPPDPNSWPNPWDPTAYFVQIPDLSTTGLDWNVQRESLDVPFSMQSKNLPANQKQLALDAHNSQDIVWLEQYCHKDEFFWVSQYNSTNTPPIVNAGLDQTVSGGAIVQLNGTGSYDADPGDTLTYQWRQVGVPTVTLSNANVAQPTFTAPSGLALDTTLSFELVVSDGKVTSVPDGVNVNVLSAQPQPVYYNIAQQVSDISASSSYPGSSPLNAIDGCIDGYPGNSNCEWVAGTSGTVGQSITLTWSQPYIVNRVTLYDRPNPSDQIISGTVSFSDTSSIPVGPLDDSARPTWFDFTARQITSLTFTVTGVSSSTALTGLAEIKVFGVPASGGNVYIITPSTGANGSIFPIRPCSGNVRWQSDLYVYTHYRV